MTHDIPDLATLCASIDDVSASLAWLPGRTPEDRNIGSIILELAECMILDNSDQEEATLITSQFLRPAEAAVIARAMAGLAVRCGAWLGREK